MPPTNKPRNIVLIAGGILIIIAYFGPLNYINLGGEEPRRGVVAMEMDYHGNILVPTLFGVNYYNKPPVHNWLILASSKVLGGFSNRVVRLPSLISLFLLILLSHRLLKKYVSLLTARMTTIFLLINIEWLLYGAVYSGEIDLFYSLVVFLQATSIFYFGSKEKTLQLYLISYFFCALGLLTKGLPSLAFQVFGLLAWSITTGKFLHLFSWKHFAGILVFGIIVTGYFYAYSGYSDPWPYIHTLFIESADKTSAGQSFASITWSAAIFIFQLFKILLPASLLLIFFRIRFIRKAIRENNLLKFFFWFIVLNLPVYWLSPNVKMRYLYMFIPMLTALIVYSYFENAELREKYSGLIDRIMKYVMLVIGVVFLAPLFFNFGITKDPLHLVNAGLIIALVLVTYYTRRFPDYAIYFFAITFLLLRVFMNYYHFPNFRARYDPVTDFIQETLTITAGEPVYYAADPDTKWIVGTLTNHLSCRDSIPVTTAPLIYTQIPFYLNLKKDKPLELVESAEAGKYYIAGKEYTTDKNITILSSTSECLGGCDGYVLFTINTKENEILP